MDVSWIRLSVCSVLSITHKFQKLCTAAILFDTEFYDLNRWLIFPRHAAKYSKNQTLKTFIFYCNHHLFLGHTFPPMGR